MTGDLGALTAAMMLVIGSASAQTATPPVSPGPPSPAAMQRQTEMLVAQCPKPPALTDAEAAKLPIHVTRWGSAGPRVLIIHGGVQGGAGGGPATFAKQESLGEEGFRVEVVDRPGFGGSPTRGLDDMERDSV